MNIRINQSLFLLIIFTLTNCSNIEFQNKASSTSKFNKGSTFDNVHLLIKSTKTILSLSKRNQYQIKISLQNLSRDTIIFPVPNEMSPYIGGEPKVRWSVIDKSTKENHPIEIPQGKKYSGFCGNVSGFSPDQIIKLAPDKSIWIKGWTARPIFPLRAGKYGVKFYYKLDPNLDQIVRGKTSSISEISSEVGLDLQELFLTSNELIFEIIE